MRRLRWNAVIGIVLALLLLPVAQTSAEQTKPFSADQLDQLVAPIALYPDSLIAQIMMASTYPLEVVQAYRWLERNKQLSDELLDLQAAQQGWDPSVVSLLHFPEVLARMNDDLVWTQDLGDAVLAQQIDVLEAVQRMRRLAYDAGNVYDTPEQRVIVEERIIRIEPATEYIYVPSYSPLIVYGPAWRVPYYYYPYFDYPVAYWYPAGYYSGQVVSFGFGLALGWAIWGNVDWYDHHLHYHHHHHHWYGHPSYPSHYRGDYDKPPVWHHNPEHRSNVRYRTPETRDRLAKTWRQLDLVPAPEDHNKPRLPVHGIADPARRPPSSGAEGMGDLRRQPGKAAPPAVKQSERTAKEQVRPGENGRPARIDSTAREKAKTQAGTQPPERERAKPQREQKIDRDASGPAVRQRQLENRTQSRQSVPPRGGSEIVIPAGKTTPRERMIQTPSGVQRQAPAARAPSERAAPQKYQPRTLPGQPPSSVGRTAKPPVVGQPAPAARPQMRQSAPPVRQPAQSAPGIGPNPPAARAPAPAPASGGSKPPSGSWGAPRGNFDGRWPGR